MPLNFLLREKRGYANEDNWQSELVPKIITFKDVRWLLAALPLVSLLAKVAGRSTFAFSKLYSNLSLQKLLCLL